MHRLLFKLQGGDLRSKGRSEEVVRLVLAKPSLTRELVRGMSEVDQVVRMRCADAFEKVTVRRPELAQEFSAEVLALLSRPQPKEILWHLLQVAPRIVWPRHQLNEVHAAVARAHLDGSNIVKACALQAEVELLPQDPARRAAVVLLIHRARASEVPAVRARGRRLATSI